MKYVAQDVPKLLIVSTVPDTLRAFFLPYARHFRKQGWKVDAATSDIGRQQDLLEAFDFVWNVPWSRNPTDVRNLLAAPSAIRRAVNMGSYDLVHVHTPVAGFVTRLALRGFRKRGLPKVIYTAHGFHFYVGGNPIMNSAYLGLERMAGRWTDQLIVINEEDRAMAQRHHIIASERVQLVPGVGVDTKKFAPGQVSVGDIHRIRLALGLEPQDRLLLMIAALDRNKRHREALCALSHLRRPHVHLALAGKGPMEREIRELAQELGLSGQVHLLGFRNDIPALIRASVATLLPSEREGLPVSVMESLSMAVPVIASNIRGIRDLVAADSGLLIPLGDTHQLSQAIDWIVAHPGEAEEMGRRGRGRMREYDIERVLARHESLYAKLMSKDQGVPARL